MLDIPKLGVPLLNNIITHVAENTEDADSFELALSILETCKGLVEKTELKQALTARSKTGGEYIAKERAVQISMMEPLIVRRMM